MKHRITAFGVACAFLVCCVLMVGVLAAFSGCATMNKILGVKDYYTIDMYTGDGTKIVTNLPNGARGFINKESFRLNIFDAQGFCGNRWWTLVSPLSCDHYHYCDTGKDILIVIWDKHGTFVKGWIYNDKGIPIKAYEETLMDLLNEIIGPPIKGSDV